MVDIIFLVVYLIAGAVMYANDVFDTDSATLVPAITFTLVGGLVITLRVFHFATVILSAEIEEAFPGLISGTVDMFKSIGNSIAGFARSLKRELR